MIHDIRLHGYVPDSAERYEYYANIVGPGVHVRIFYEQSENSRGRHDRFFLGGNEIALYKDRLYHRGNGGKFCEYMIGMELPAKDLLKPSIQNSLVMYGARYDADGRIIFTNDTNGYETFTRIFSDGHACCNYYFFIGGDIQGELKTVQETILRFAGKLLKRTSLANDPDGSRLAIKLAKEINIPRWTLFIIKLVDRYAFNYRRKFLEIYNSGTLTTERENLRLLAQRYLLKRSECEHLEMDVIQNHPNNYQIVDDYKRLIIERKTKDTPSPTLEFKRSKLRTVTTGQYLPIRLFDKLDQMLQPQRVELSIPDYVQQAQTSLTKILASPVGENYTVSELIILLRAKLAALREHYSKFDDYIIEVGQKYSKEAEDILNIIMRHFERFQSAYETIHSVAFVDDYALTIDQIYAIAQAQDILDNLSEGLFDELVFQVIERQQYLNLYGRKRLRRLKEGINCLIAGQELLPQMLTDIERINADLRLKRLVDNELRKKAEQLPELISRIVQEDLRTQISQTLIIQGLITEPVSEDIFAAAIFSLREERLYLKELLPDILANQDWYLREDFLQNSELDRFRTEELEQQYFQQHPVSAEVREWFNCKAKS